MHTGYIHSIDTFGSVDGPGVCPLRGIHAGLSHALPLLPQSRYAVNCKGTFLPGRLHPHFRRIRSFRRCFLVI